ncbi:nitrate/nitrite two-component system sensor histidine kinase [Pseudomonas aeruginosa]|uniref:histidine kinase n=1 Tax=Pseudomonas aeruginosa TaxID=287 RepID=UPI00071B2ECF|nr:histidine kinase [Pseudomonas aeruginosa]KSJ06345.1 nitrate/nitrite two-component system sensor histidine kinase [Pseudomonas aeruginosa]
MNKATAPDADQRDRFFGGSDRAGKPILRRSLVVRFGCYLTLLVSLALIGMFSALLFADYTHQDAAVINHAGSLRMLTYRVALEPSLEGRQALLGTLGERLDSGDIRRLLQRQDADDPIRQLHQELREGLARLDPRALPGRAVLDARVTYSGEDELAQLGERFNQMAGELKSIYGDLEERVEDKTRTLSQSHQRLELLYDSARRLGENPYDSRTLQPLLNQLEKVLDAGRVTLCLNKDGVERAYSSLTTTERPADFCLQGDCGSCREQASACDQPSSLAQPLLMQPLSIAGHRFGELFIESRSGRLENWQQQLIETFCDNIARTFALSLQQEQESRLALFAERGTIALELHDSLAQSLSYLKIQVSRLGTLLKREAPAEKIEDTLDELREGLNGAYRQLRELLTTFRLSLDEPSLEAALGNAVAEFGERGEVTIELDNRLQHVPLSPNEEIHVLQIVREALSNVVRHSQAQRAWVRLSSQADGQVSIAVEDDGVGFDPQQNRSGHYGLTIMQERGQTLGSQLRFEARAPHGTRVLFSFVPTALQPSAAKEPTP